MQKKKNALATIGLAAILMILPAVVFAGWLDKTSDLLKTFGGSDKGTALTTEEIGAGLKEALKVGSQRVVEQLGAKDGFNSDPQIHIPLPGSLVKVKSMLSKVGMAHLFEDLELKLNRAAEAATPKAKRLFVNAITQMTLEDVQKIYNGPEDAATQYFKEKMSEPLAGEMKPVVTDTLSQVGAVQAYDKMISAYKKYPFVPDAKANLTEYVTEKGMDGIFYYLAKEEAAIRKDPVKRTTELLKKVFTR